MSETATTSVRKNAVIATIAIFGSRVFGLVREQAFAFFFGASFALDAYIAAFRIPNLLRDLFAEGALSQSFTTVFAQKTAHDKDKEAYGLANKVVTFLLITLGIIVILGIIFSPQIISLIASGFSGEKFDLTVSLNRILFPFILFVAIAALLMGMLNAKNKFFLPQSASTFFNITSIVAGLIFAYLMAPEYIGPLFSKLLGRGNGEMPALEGLPRAIMGMAIGTLLGGFVQMVVQLPTLMKLGYKPKIDLGFRNPDFIKILALTGPAIIGGASVQVNVMVNTFFASFLPDGSISYLNYAFRFMQFPLGLFGVAIAIASAPALAKLIAQNKENDFRQTMRNSLQMSLFFSVPSTIGLVILSKPIISLIYEHGKFNASDTHQTALALMAYSIGIIGYSLIKIYQPAYLAFHDSKTPMRISLASMIVNVAVGALFMYGLHFSHWGLALSTSLVAVLNFFILAVIFKKKISGVWNRHLVIHSFKCIAASVVMGIAAWICHFYVRDFWLDQKIINQLAGVFLPMSVAISVYFLACHLLGIQEARGFTKSLRKKLTGK